MVGRAAWGTACVLALAASTATAQVEFPPRPGERAFIADEAQMIPAETQAQIVQICDRLLTESKIPIVVVTIPSLSHYGARGWSIERYAHNLFDEWGIGYADTNRGVLLLVSRGDRKARIELGADWGGGKHADSQTIMDRIIVPRFKAGDFGEGCLAGVAALDAMVRDQAVPAKYRPRTPPWVKIATFVVIGLAIFTAVSLYRRGASGWAWLFWGGVFVTVFFILRSVAESRGRSGGGGSFGGGSFGGGFSGGGGATGSW